VCVRERERERRELSHLINHNQSIIRCVSGMRSNKVGLHVWVCDHAIYTYLNEGVCFGWWVMGDTVTKWGED